MTDEQHHQDGPEEAIEDVEAREAAQADVTGGDANASAEPSSTCARK